MRVFVTGATGFVGSAVVPDLISAGHQVLGLTRSDAGAKALAAAGAEPHHGELTDLDSLERGAAACDGVIHLAFIHDFSKFMENCAIEGRALGAITEVLEGTGRPLVVTSGTGVVAAHGAQATEDTPVMTDFPRAISETSCDAAAAKGIRAMIIRLPPITHDVGDGGFLPPLINIAREKGVAAYVGDGANRWPAVHRTDAASLYRLALEKGRAGARYHAIAEEGVPFKTIAEAIGRGLGLPVRSLTTEEAPAHFGFFNLFAGADISASSAKTRAELGWSAKGAGLIADIDNADLAAPAHGA